ncbi:MAG: cell division protein [Phycisphaerales bacterium]|nr:cell division protein [Phycisphaerales bacterium]
MYTLRVAILIDAPVAVCFDLARSVDAHVKSAAGTGERVVGGRRSGLLELGDEVTWEGRHFGFVQRLSSRITEFRPFTFFQDRMAKGAFRFLEHDHVFQSHGGGTLMTDVLRFEAPFGPLGWVAERVVLDPHLRRFLVARGRVLKAMAEDSRPSGTVTAGPVSPNAAGRPSRVGR